VSFWPAATQVRCFVQRFRSSPTGEGIFTFSSWQSELIYQTVEKASRVIAECVHVVRTTSLNNSMVCSFHWLLLLKIIDLGWIWRPVCTIVAKRCEIGLRLLLITNKKSHAPFQMRWESSALDDLEGQYCSRNCIHCSASSLAIAGLSC